MATRVAVRKPVESPGDSAEPAALGPGSVLGRYELQRPLAAGGMAQVWVATQSGALGFRKTVALKTIRPDRAHDATFREMFLDEARLASRIHHANVVEVLDLGVEGSIVFQAMPLVAGASLSALLRALQGERMPVPLALRVMLDMLRGLHAAHELCDDDGTKLGLVHRDVSPQNLLVGVDGVAKLSDFGIAKAFGRIAQETTDGSVRGKVRYMAPEVLEGMPPSPQSDLFACGVMLWEVLTGVALFQGPSSTALVEARFEAPLRDPREVVPGLPAPICAVAMRALALDPFARYASAREMAEAIESVVRDGSLGATQEELGDWVRAVLEGRAPQPAASADTTTTTLKHVVEPPVDDGSATVAVSVESRPLTIVTAAPPPVTRSRRPLFAAVIALPLVAGIVVWRASAKTDPPPPVVSAPPPVATMLPSVDAPAVEEIETPPAPSSAVAPTPSAHAPKHRPPVVRKTKPAPPTPTPTPGGATPVLRNPY